MQTNKKRVWLLNSAFHARRILLLKEYNILSWCNLFPFSMTGPHACYQRQTQNTWWTIAAFSESSTNQACRFVSCTNTSSEASLQPQGFHVHTNHQIIRWAPFSCKHLCQYCFLHRAGCRVLLEICCWGVVFELTRGVTHGLRTCRQRDFSILAYNKWNHLKETKSSSA